MAQHKLTRVVIVDDFCSSNGGATQLAILSAKSCRQKSIAVTYISGVSGSNPELEEMGVEIVSLNSLPLLKKSKRQAFTKGIFDQDTKTGLMEWIEANDSPNTIYHLHGWGQSLSPSIFQSLALVHDRVLLHAHDYFLLCPNGAFFEYPKSQLCERKPLSISCLSTNCDKRNYPEKLWRCARQIVQRSLFDISTKPAKIILIHEGMQQYFTRSGIPLEKCVTIRNPVLPFTSARVRAEGNKKVFFIGRVCEEKGVEDVIIATGIAGVDLVVVGDGQMRLELEAKYPNVSFLGWKHRSEIGVLVQDARLLVMPSRYPEPFGMVCLEAATSGVPVIVPPSALLSSDVLANGIGYVCETSQHQGLAETLRQAARDDAGIELMSKAGLYNASKLAPTPSEWGDQLVAAYLDALP